MNFDTATQRLLQLRERAHNLNLGFQVAQAEAQLDQLCPAWRKLLADQNDLRRRFRFFQAHAGGAVGERAITAIELARAERYAIQQEWDFQWIDDFHLDWKTDNYQPQTCEECVLFDVERNTVLASLSCIDDADDNYRRVVEAELALEAIARESAKR